jgi:hypothetical protein
VIGGREAVIGTQAPQNAAAIGSINSNWGATHSMPGSFLNQVT